MSRKKENAQRFPDGDDGRVIANMNVDGMPWYTDGVSDPFRTNDAPEEDKPLMSGDERRGYVWAAVKASLLIGAVFVVVYGLFLLFCSFVWLR